MKQNNENKALTIDNTMFSQQQLIYCLLLILAFGAVLCFYLCMHKISNLKNAPIPQKHIAVENDYCKLKIPVGFYSYSKGDDFIYINSDKDLKNSAKFVISFQKSPLIKYSALNSSSVLLLTKLEMIFRKICGDSYLFILTSKDIIPRNEGGEALHFFVQTGNRIGEGVVFIAGDLEVFCVTLLEPGASYKPHQILANLDSLLELKNNSRDLFDRPFCDIQKLSREEMKHRFVQAERELQIAKMYSDRSKDSPKESIMLSLKYYQNGINILSSIGREDLFLNSAAEADFLRLMTLRKEQLANSKDQFDKNFNMGNYAVAKKIAEEMIKDTSELDTETEENLKFKELKLEVSRKMLKTQGKNKK